MKDHHKLRKLHAHATLLAPWRTLRQAPGQMFAGSTGAHHTAPLAQERQEPPSWSCLCRGQPELHRKVCASALAGDGDLAAPEKRLRRGRGYGYGLCFMVYGLLIWFMGYGYGLWSWVMVMGYGDG